MSEFTKMLRLSRQRKAREKVVDRRQAKRVSDFAPMLEWRHSRSLHVHIADIGGFLNLLREFRCGQSGLRQQFAQVLGKPTFVTVASTAW